MVEAEGAMLVLLDGPRRRAQLTRHELEQRRLAATVWTDQRDAAVAVDAEVERLVQRLAARVREGDVVKGEDGRRQPRALGEGESEGGLAQLRLLDRARLELLEHLLLRLCGGGDAVRLVDAHKVGELVDVGLLFLVHLELQPLLLLHRLHELGVVSSVQPQQPAAQPERVRADGVQKVLAVRDEEEALRVRGEVLLEPDARLQVEVVGRLVQQQQLWRSEERLGERDAHPPAARHVLGRPVHRDEVVRKPETRQDLSRARLRAGRVELAEPVVDRLEPLVLWPDRLEDRLRHGLEPLDLGADMLDDGLDAAQLGRRSLLVQVVDRDVLRQRHLALCDSGQHVGLAGAVVA
mmetsp:Transcript_26521/g.85032  ORF Transcript_26521/g.85032 Transcript_26521/m.85032 type:complete len:351 (+) Transcript_26521:644-1696(+)